MATNTRTRLTHAPLRVAMVGAGTIGASWALVFARAGCEVRIFDADASRAQWALEETRRLAADVSASNGIPEGHITFASTLTDALDSVQYVQESIAENLDAKAALFDAMDRLAPADCVLASSCSSIPPEDLFANVLGRGRCIVAHPFNPPHIIPLVEIVLAPFTSADVVSRALEIQSSVGQKPVLLNKAIPGYVGNRLQVAVVNEALSLVGRGVISPADLDACVRWGLGQRWALMGPFETMDLNAAGGFADYVGKFGQAYQSLGADLRVADAWNPEAVDAVTRWRRQALPASGLPARMAWRNRELQRLRDGEGES